MGPERTQAQGRGSRRTPEIFYLPLYQPLISEGIADYESPCSQLVDDFVRVSMVAKEHHDPKAT